MSVFNLSSDKWFAAMNCILDEHGMGHATEEEREEARKLAKYITEHGMHIEKCAPYLVHGGRNSDMEETSIACVDFKIARDDGDPVVVCVGGGEIRVMEYRE